MLMAQGFASFFAMQLAHGWVLSDDLLQCTIDVMYAAHNFLIPERSKIMLVAILNALRSWRRYNQSMRELSQLGDRELADIGITRGDIARIAWQDAHQR
jgi:uncharacterized protein YjiS (DUF1127 family)